jgi:hypothetical protein
LVGGDFWRKVVRHWGWTFIAWTQSGSSSGSQAVFQSTTFTNYPPADIETGRCYWRWQSKGTRPGSWQIMILSISFRNSLMRRLGWGLLQQVPCFAKKIWSWTNYPAFASFSRIGN